MVLSAGTYGSLAILLRLDIGPRDELKELGTPVSLDLPAVGKNLMDHLVRLIRTQRPFRRLLFFVQVLLNFYEVSKPNLTNDHLIWHTGGRECTAEEYKLYRTGFFSQFPFGVFAFARLDEQLQDSLLWQQAAKENRSNNRDALGTLPSQPHVEFWNTECYSPKYMFTDFPPRRQIRLSYGDDILLSEVEGRSLASVDRP